MHNYTRDQHTTRSRIVVSWMPANIHLLHNPHKRLTQCRPIYLHDSGCRECLCPVVPRSSTVKYLGLTFDETLAWDTHIQEVAKRLRVVCSYIYSLQFTSDSSIRKMVYKSLGESVVRYGLTIYGHASQYRLNILNRILKRISRSISYGTLLQGGDIDLIMQQLEMLSVDKQFAFDALCKHYFSNTFKVDNKKQRPLRRIEPFVIPRIYTNYGKRMRSYYIPCLFNKLKVDAALHSFKKIKTSLRLWLTEIPWLLSYTPAHLTCSCLYCIGFIISCVFKFALYMSLR